MSYDYGTIFNDVIETNIYEESKKTEKKRKFYIRANNEEIRSYVLEKIANTEKNLIKNKERLEKISPIVDLFHKNYGELKKTMSMKERQKIENKISEYEEEIKEIVENPPRFIGGNLVNYACDKNLIDELDFEVNVDGKFVIISFEEFLKNGECQKLLKSIRRSSVL